MSSHTDGPAQPDRVDRRGGGAPLAWYRAIPSGVDRDLRRWRSRVARRARDERLAKRRHMQKELLDVLRCPFCGGRLELVSSSFHRCDADEIVEGILGCHCCVYPVVAGIPLVHLDHAVVEAREHIEAGRPDQAFRRMLSLDDTAAARFEGIAASDTATYRDVVEALGPGFEGGYFLYRFSDPTYVVAEAVVRTAAKAVMRAEGGAGGTVRRARAIDVCGGSGHLTRSLLGLSSPPSVLADLYFPKLWLARRFTAPGCPPACFHGNIPPPLSQHPFHLLLRPPPS